MKTLNPVRTLLSICTAAFPFASQALDGTYTVSETYEITVENDDPPLTKTFRGTLTGTLVITNNQYVLIDKTGLPISHAGLDLDRSISFNGTTFRVEDGYPLEGVSVPYVFVKLSFFLVAVNFSSEFAFSFIEPVRSTKFVTTGTHLSSLSGSGAAIEVDGLNVMASSTSSLVPVAGPPIILQDPSSVAVSSGQNATFRVAATGNPKPVLQWQYRAAGSVVWADLNDGANYVGTTTDTLVVIGATQNMNGDQFRCVATNSSGSVVSVAGLLSVISFPPSITAQPQNQSVNAGTLATFTIMAAGSDPLAFHWQRRPVAPNTWSNLVSDGTYLGATTASLTVQGTTSAMNEDQFRCVVTNMSGTVTSAVATLMVTSPNQPPSITTQPVGQYATIGSSVSFSVTASGSQPLGYQWQKDGADISGATDPIFNIASVQTSSTGAYRVRVSNSSGTNSSDIATLTVVNEAYVQPVTNNISGAFSNEASGQIADSIVVPQPFEIVHVTWYGYHQTELSPGVSAIPFRLRFFQDESGKPNATPVFDQAVNASVQSTGQGMNTPSDFYNGRVLFRYEADLNPGFSIPAGVTVWFSIVNRTDVYYWLWARSSFLPNELAYRGANDPWQTAQLGQMAFSSYAPLAAPIETAPKITIQPQSQKVNAGQDVTFCIVATGTAPLSYFWRKNGAPIPEATNVCLFIANVQATDAGLYSVEVRNTAGSALSVEAKLQLTGTVVAWGWNNHGQTNVPAGLSSVIAIAAGGYHSVALKTDGTVVAWGAGKRNTGSIQDIDYGQSIIPAGLSGVRAIAAGVVHTVALKSDGTVVAWGANFFGETNVPSGLTGVIAIAAGGNSSAALKGDGIVVAWGNSGSGQRNLPAGLNGVTAIAVGGYHTVALKGDGTVVAWGYNGRGQTNVPPGLTGVTAIAAGGLHTVALKSDGTVVAWGDNSSGQTNVPAGLTGVVAIAAGWNHTAALKADGTLVAWERNAEGQTTLPAVIAESIGSKLRLLWPVTAADLRIESTASLSPPMSWTNVSGTFETNNGTISVALPIAGPQEFYRLTKP